ncbi:hypothetical protein [Zavarzinia sp. CC-PAN008]|uniref:hypothetical protein n=1 Tax=Zavarzinia sp. CC-PAN008 TaxID=3243332 RepID=UPI003F74419A
MENATTERKAELVQALLHAIDRHGLTLPAHDLIAQEAHGAREALLRSLAQSDELLIAACEHLADIYRDTLLMGIVEAQAPERLSLFLDFYFDFLSAKGLPKPADDRLYDALLALAATSPALRASLRGQYELLQHVIAHEVQISHPMLGQAACREIGFLFVGMMIGHWKLVASLGFSESWNQVTRRAIDRLIESYKLDAA